MTYKRDPRVDQYIARLPAWQQNISHQLRDLIHAADPEVLETIKRTVQPYFVLDGIVTAGHTNKTARTISFRQGDRINRRALSMMLKQIIANNRAGGWRKLKT